MPEETLNVPDSTEGFKKTAVKVGLYIMICFVLRYIAGFAIQGAQYALGDSAPANTVYAVSLMISGLFLQVLPSLIGAFMFGVFGKLKEMYRIPKSCKKAVSSFPAIYGMAQIVNIVTMIFVFIFTNNRTLTDVVNNSLKYQPFDTPTALAMMVLAVLVAPLFEEFMFRGLLMNALKPYGNGLAIFTTAVLFGLFHGNFRQFFYTAVMGIALGYIANVTGSVVPGTIIHMIFNGISSIMMLLLTTHGVQEYILGGNADAIPDEDMLAVAIYGIFSVCLLIFIIVGIVAAVIKLKKIKRFKVPKVCPEISNGKKVSMLIFTVPALISLLMIIDTFFGFSDMLLGG